MEKKILKIQQKEKQLQQINLHSKTNTTSAFNLNNSNIQANLSYLQKHNNQNKKKIMMPNSKGFDSMQKRSSSALDDGYFQGKPKKVPMSNIVSSSSTPKKLNDETTLLKESLNSSSKNHLIFSHIKQQKKFPSNFINKGAMKLKVDPKFCAKTSFPTKENTRKNSPFHSKEVMSDKKPEKIIIKHGYNSLGNKSSNKEMKGNEKGSKEGSTSFKYHNSPGLESDRDNKKKTNYYNMDSDSNIINEMNNKNQNTSANSFLDKILSKVMKKNYNLEKKDKVIKIDKSKDKSNVKETENGKENKKPKEKPKLIIKDKKSDKKIIKGSPDRDIDNEENMNDSFLQYVNSNIESKGDATNSTSNLNNSYDSNFSIQSEAAKFYSLTKDVELIISYLMKYYQKYKDYPKTKIHFYKYGRLLGKGAFGKVNLALHVLTGRLVAIKSINKKKIKSERQKAKINLETSIMKKLSKSSYVVRVLENYETQKHICIVMEYICAGDLLSYIKKRSKINEQLAKYIFKQIMVGLYHIHANHIVHLDIKLDNILIDLDNKVKICDFGVSKKIKKGDIMTEQCGTPAYMAPEIIKGNGYEGYAVDLWSVGVVLYAMLSGTIPFKGSDINDLNSLILKGKYKEVEGISREATHLLKCLLEVDPKKRITDEAVLNHPWLAGVDISKKNEVNLFTNSERILLAQSNVDYRDINNKDNMVENFSLKNLDSNDDQNQKNIQTKSLILAPYNSSYDDNYLSEDDSILYSICDQDNDSIKVRNGLIKFQGKTKELNRNYELNNNGEIDNGIIISQNDSENNCQNNKSPAVLSNNFSPVSALSPMEFDSKKLKENYFQEFQKKIDERIVSKVSELGYKKNYIMKCLKDNEFNYTTSTYYLLDKYK
ncbi:MAG: protein kinase [archaeon]|nr:protein kinase [archaeon]